MLEEEVYMKQPKGYENEGEEYLVWKWKKYLRAKAVSEVLEDSTRFPTLRKMVKVRSLHSYV